MCGIFATLPAHMGTLNDELRNKLHALFQTHHKDLKMRGPEATRKLEPCPEVLFAFYRLIISGLSDSGMQPFHLDEYLHLYVICNGEIYDNTMLDSEIDYTNQIGSDCKGLVSMIARFGFQQTLKCLDGVFAVGVWYDKEKKLWLGKVPLGVRPLFLAIEKSSNKSIVSGQAASKIKSLTVESLDGKNNGPFAQPFTPGTYVCFRFNSDTRQIVKEVEDRYFMPSWPENGMMTLPEALEGVNRMFRRAVVKRLMSERPISCLLSGGLDSSLVVSIGAQEMGKTGRKINTFSIGMEGSTDLKFTKTVADHIGSIHHKFLLTTEDFPEAIDNVIWISETWDTTTVRARVGNYLVCKKIAEYKKTKENFDDRVIVIFNGNGSDELIGGYLYHYRKAPTKLNFHLESERLLAEIYCFDVLRSDRIISNNGLEARTPFLNKHFVGHFMSIPIDIRFNRDVCEKWLLREAFSSENLLPEVVLNRTKEAFSDGVSGTERSWWQIIQDHIMQQKGLDKLTLTDPQISTENEIASDLMHKEKQKVLFIFGTRPEAIKMAPIIIKSKKIKEFSPIVCATGQHREMLNQVLDFFQISPDYNLELMSANQDLYDVTIKGLKRVKLVIEETKPDIILVQGDTTTSFIGSLAGYYSKIKVGHVEAGLRSSNKFSPYPEEIFRTLNGHIADIHFAPTKTTIDNLAKENITKNVFLTGNTVIDALLLGLDIIRSKGEETYYDEFRFIDFTKKIILITCHRRETFGTPLNEICRAVKDIAESYKDKVHFVYPVHLNPNVQNNVQEKLANISNISVIEPLSYNHCIWLMNKAYLIITDSGGIQEEAPSLGKPVLVTRDVTERVEAIDAGAAKLVGAKYKNIVRETKKLIEDNNYYQLMSKANNPYGDGRASEYIIDILKHKLKS